ncbi:MAG: nuclear transport factor 2 family protein [Candidatus Binatia bacterium]
MDFETMYQIQRAMVLYGQLLDDLRMEEWGDLFTEDAVWSIPDTTFRGREAIVRGVRAMEPPTPGRVKHVVFTPIVELDGANSARAWSDFLAFARNQDDTWRIAGVGRYYDRLVRAGGRWRFASRAVDLHPKIKPQEPLLPGPAR